MKQTAMTFLTLRIARTGAVPAALIFAWSAAIAGEPPTASDESVPDWSFKVGAGAYMGPEYDGSDDFESFLFPSIDATYKDIFFASVIDGIGFNLIRDPAWGVTVSGQIVMGRDSEGDIEPLPSIDDRVMPKVEVFRHLGPTRIHGAVIGDGKRYSREIGLQYVRPLSERALYVLGGGARWNNSDWNDERFSLSLSEAASLGVEPYMAKASFSAGYIEGALIYYLSPVYVLETVFEVAKLTGDPADSPLVTEFGTTTQPVLFIRIHRQL